MKEIFIEKDFGTEARSMIERVNGILEDYRSQGYDLSLRQLYYQLVSRNIITNEERSYKNLGNLVSDARLAGFVDWDMIKDRGREMVSNPHWKDPANFIEVVAPQFRFDLWADQPNYVDGVMKNHIEPRGLRFWCKNHRKTFILCLDESSGWNGWLFYKHPDGFWVSFRRANAAELKLLGVPKIPTIHPGAVVL